MVWALWRKVKYIDTGGNLIPILRSSRPQPTEVHKSQTFARMTNLYDGAQYFQHNSCSFPLTKRTVLQFTYTERKASDNRQVKRSLQNCGHTVRNLLRVTLPKPKILDMVSRFLENF
jgi:16S rRNA U516 pseudouridylate synthase RsuA-like enzyme